MYGSPVGRDVHDSNRKPAGAGLRLIQEKAVQSLPASLNILITPKLPYPLFRNIPGWRNNKMVNKG